MEGIARRLNGLDRFLTLWIFLAMALGIALGRFWPEAVEFLNSFQYGSTNLLIAVGLILMMVPPLAKVRFSRIFLLLKDLRLSALSLTLNWLVGPILMFLLALTFFHDQPGFYEGLILIGVARCIAMVLVWNDLADGDRELAAGLVALNSLFQILFYSGLVYVFLTVVPEMIGLDASEYRISFWDVAESVLIYLGIPFALALVMRFTLIPRMGEAWYVDRFQPAINPVTPIALLLTIVVMFASQGAAIITLPERALLIAMPLLAYFGIMFLSAMWISKRLRLSYEQSAAVAFTAAGNNFELAIAVSAGLWGVASEQAFTGVIGPLVEVPALILLVRVALRLRKRFSPNSPDDSLAKRAA